MWYAGKEFVFVVQDTRTQTVLAVTEENQTSNRPKLATSGVRLLVSLA